ncbi:MAG TPA: MtrB/PioB family outer membrane beta-barrel protein, partial [Myxococcota bacterium]|nr:MtrB/PioB family outer membrane beta-barrel protein [Myxococcota bacterium]
GGWFARGALELGASFGGSATESETRYTKYTDLSSGFRADGLDFELWRPETGDHAMLRAGDLGKDDQFYDFEASRAGWLRLRGSFSGVPHKYASDATSLWLGGGSQVLTLPAGLTPGASSLAEIAAALATHPEGTLEVQRDRTQLELRVRALPSLSFTAFYGLDDRKGAIPQSVGFAYPDFSGALSSGGNVEVPAPVDDKTHTGKARVDWSSDLVQASLAYNTSIYRNQLSSLTLQQPFDDTAGANLAQITQARLALPPDNEWQNVRGDVAVDMPLRSRLTTAVSWSQSTQNQDLLAPTVSNVTIGSANLANWNTAAALSQRSARARVDQVLADVHLTTSPWHLLRLRTGYRFTNQDTQTDYIAFNPQTKQYGYIVEDGGHASALGQDYLGVFEPGFPGSAWRYRTIPFGESRSTVDAGATLMLPLRSSFDVALEQEDVDRDVSERPQTRERRATVALTSHALSFATLRLSYKYIARDGGPIDYSVYQKYTTAALPGFVPLFPDGDGAHNLNQLVRPSLADLAAQRFAARLNFALGARSDLSLAAGLRSDDYGSSYGLTSDRTRNLEADWTVQISPNLSATAFGSLEAHDRGMQTIRGFATTADGNAGGPNFPFSNQWGMRSRGDATGWGGTLTAHPLSWIQFDTRYTFLVTHEADHLAFNSFAALASGAPPVPTALPTLRNRDHVVETSLRFALRKSLGLRFYYRYDRSGVDDFHQTALPTLVGRRVYFGHQDVPYEAGFYGVALQFSFGAGW